MPPIATVPSSTRPSSGRLLLLLVTLVAVTFVGGCAGGDPVVVNDPVAGGDTYIHATLTVLDAAPPCVGASCPPEYFTCRGSVPVATGTILHIDCNSAATGMKCEDSSPSPDKCTSIVISGTDIAREMGVALQFSLNDVTNLGVAALTTTATPTSPAGNPSVFVDVDVRCDQVNSNGVSLSRFIVVDDAQTDYPAGYTNSVTLDAFPTSGIHALPAEMVGSTFNPPGIVSGTFRFVGRARQPAVPDDLRPFIAVEGCFRVNIPFNASGFAALGVPVNPAAAGASCP